MLTLRSASGQIFRPFSPLTLLYPQKRIEILPLMPRKYPTLTLNSLALFTVRDISNESTRNPPQERYSLHLKPLGRWFFLEGMEEMDSTTLVKAVRRASREGRDEEELWKAYSQRAIEISNLFDLEDSINLICAYAEARHQQFAVFSTFSERILQLIEGETERTHSKLNGRLITSLIIACSRLNYTDSILMNSLVAHIRKNLTDLKPKDLVSLAHSYSKMGVFNEEILRLVSDVLPPYIPLLTPMSISKLLLALSRSKIYSNFLLDQIIRDFEERYASFGCLEMMNFLLGYSRILHTLPPTSRWNNGKAVKIMMFSLQHCVRNFGVSFNLQILESLILVNQYDYAFVNEQLLPVILTKLRHLPDSIDFKLLPRLLSCLARFPEVSAHTQKPLGASHSEVSSISTSRGADWRASSTSSIPPSYSSSVKDSSVFRFPPPSPIIDQLISQILSILAEKLESGDLLSAVQCICSLHMMRKYDANIFLKVEDILLASKKKLKKKLSKKQVSLLHEAFSEFGKHHPLKSEFLAFLAHLHSTSPHVPGFLRFPDIAHMPEGVRTLSRDEEASLQSTEVNPPAYPSAHTKGSVLNHRFNAGQHEVELIK